MAHERLIEDVRHRERGADTWWQEQLEAMGRGIRRVIGRSRHQSADRDIAEHELAVTPFGSNSKSPAASGRGVLTTLPREPPAECVVRRRCGAHRLLIAGEPHEADSSILDPTNFAVAVVKPEAAITVFKDAQSHDIGD